MITSTVLKRKDFTRFSSREKRKVPRQSHMLFSTHALIINPHHPLSSPSHRSLVHVDGVLDLPQRAAQPGQKRGAGRGPRRRAVIAHQHAPYATESPDWSIGPCIGPFIWSTIHWFVHRFVHWSIGPFIGPFFWSVRPFVHLLVYSLNQPTRLHRMRERLYKKQCRVEAG